MKWEAGNGFGGPVGSPALVNWAKGTSASHIMASMTTPEMAAMRMATPAMRAMPMRRGPSMNRRLAHQGPAMAGKKDGKGPIWTEARKPLVGEPPLIQALADGVA